MEVEEEKDLNRDWVISYQNDGTPFVEQSDSSDDESDTELDGLDAELELVVPQDPPNEGLKALDAFGTAEAECRQCGNHTEPDTVLCSPDTPIKTPNPAAAVLEWPMGGQDPKAAYENSPIGIFMSNNYPDATGIEDWFDISDLTPTDFHNLSLNDSNYGRHLAVAVAMMLGWLPHKRECHKCKGTMKIGSHEGLQDKLNWACNNDGPNQHASKKSKKKPAKCQILQHKKISKIRHLVRDL